MDVGPLNAALLDAHGESVTVHVSDGASPPVVTDTPLTACFRGPWGRTDYVGAPVEQQNVQMLFPAVDTVSQDGVTTYKGWTGTGAKEGSTVTARGTGWTVVDTQVDDGGMVLVSVRAFT